MCKIKKNTYTYKTNLQDVDGERKHEHEDDVGKGRDYMLVVDVDEDHDVMLLHHQLMVDVDDNIGFGWIVRNQTKYDLGMGNYN